MFEIQTSCPFTGLDIIPNSEIAIKANLR